MLIIQIQVWLMLRRVFRKVIHFHLFNHINLFSSYLIHNTAAFDNEHKPILTIDYFNQVMSSQSQVSPIQPSLIDKTGFKLEPGHIENSIKLKNKAGLEQDKKFNNAVAQKLILNNEIKIEKFIRNNTEHEREKNSEILRNRMSRQFSQNCVMKIMAKINQFNQKLQSERTKIGETKALKHEKSIIKAVYKIVSEEFKDLDKAKQLLKIFASCNPSSLQHKKIACNTTPKWENYFDEKRIYKSQIIETNHIQKDLPIANRQSSDNLHLINSKQKQNPTWLQLKTIEQKNFSLSENNIKRVEKILFGNKKIIHDQAIFKRSNNPKSSQQTIKFGENWVYAYDLPYKFDKTNAGHLIKMISSKYGQITEYDVEDYSELVQKSTTQVVFSLPENYIEETSKKRVRIQRNEIEVCQQINEQMNKNLKKSLVEKILKKGKDQQNLMFNKSTMVFKFKNKQDKMNFLTGEMRLYGLCIDKFKNIRFQQAQSKNVISITMVPWECQTDEIVRVINSSLSSLNIKMHADPGIITSGYLFLELNNFGQALQSKRFLNGIPFQDKILKARLCYGSSYLHEGKYKYNYEMDHYEALVSKLEQLRQEHRLNMIR